uniref:Membrane-fusion protein-like protein n=1 Tax=Chlorobium chlorochromatii (strain CaD3) TaxID=340177 RepID=Q3AQQ8_CHLCH
MKKNIGLALGGAVLFIMILLFFFNPFSASDKSTTLVTVQRRDAVPPPNSTLHDSTSYAHATEEAGFISGIVEPYNDATIGLVVQGKIASIWVPEGRRVGRGGIILTLEKSQEELEVARRKIIWQNQAELKSAEAVVTTLTETLRLNRKLYDETRSVSREELDKLSLQWENAVAERDRLRNQKLREKVEYEIAAKTLDSRLLKAPFSGTVEKVFLKVGEIYQPGQPLVRLIDADRCVLTANIDDTKNYKFKQGMTVELHVMEGSSEVIRKGTITKVPIAVDPASGVMQVKAFFDNRDGRIKPGTTAKMRVPQE